MFNVHVRQESVQNRMQNLPAGELLKPFFIGTISSTAPYCDIFLQFKPFSLSLWFERREGLATELLGVRICNCFGVSNERSIN